VLLLVPTVSFTGEMIVEILYHVYEDTKKLLQVIYAGDSAADEFAMEALKGVAYTYKVLFTLDV
jgi:hypothetical protein